jgi:hypothetical protein
MLPNAKLIKAQLLARILTIFEGVWCASNQVAPPASKMPMAVFGFIEDHEG